MQKNAKHINVTGKELYKINHCIAIVELQYIVLFHIVHKTLCDSISIS